MFDIREPWRGHRRIVGSGATLLPRPGGPGATVIGIARRQELPARLAQEMRSRLTGFVHGVLRRERHRPFRIGLAGHRQAEHGRIDVLVNNAGMGPPRGEERHDLPVHRVMETNYFAAVAGTLAVLSGMLERHHGAVVNVSSDSGRAPGPHEGAYSASKAAVSAFTESLSFDTEGRGVHLHVLYPGWVPTAMGSEAVDAGMPMPPRLVRRSEEQVSQLLLARLGGSKVDIDAAPVARLAPVGRALFPAAYRKAVSKAGG